MGADVTVGSWMLAFNVSHFDDRRMCAPACGANAVAVRHTERCADYCQATICTSHEPLRQTSSVDNFKADGRPLRTAVVVWNKECPSSLGRCTTSQSARGCAILLRRCRNCTAMRPAGRRNRRSLCGRAGGSLDTLLKGGRRLRIEMGRGHAIHNDPCRDFDTLI